MFNSPLSIMAFSVLPIFFIFRFAYLAENESFCNLIDCLNEKYGKFFIIATLCCTLFTLYLDQSGQTDFLENPVSLGIVYFLVLTASNLRVYDGFGIVFMLVGNVSFNTVVIIPKTVAKTKAIHPNNRPRKYFSLT